MSSFMFNATAVFELREFKEKKKSNMGTKSEKYCNLDRKCYVHKISFRMLCSIKIVLVVTLTESVTFIK